MDKFKLLRHDVIVQFTMRSLKTLKFQTCKPRYCLELTKIFKTLTTICVTKLVNIRLVIEFNVSVAVMDKISNFSLN